MTAADGLTRLNYATAGFRLNHLVNEGADLSWDMAIRLVKAFGSTPEGWMRLQFQNDAAQVEERAKKIRYVQPVFLKPSECGDFIL